MYKITLIRYVLKNGKEEIDTTPHLVDDLEAYKNSLKQAKHKTINFVYETIE